MKLDYDDKKALTSITRNLIALSHDLINCFDLDIKDLNQVTSIEESQQETQKETPTDINF